MNDDQLNAQPDSDGEHNSQPLRLEVVSYRPSSYGWLLTVRVLRNSKQIFQGRVMAASHKSRERFARDVMAALIRETGYSGDAGLYFTLVTIWVETFLLTEAAILDEIGGGDPHSMALLLATTAGHA